MKKYKYLFIGHFSDNVGDGQVIKTNSVKNHLFATLGENNIEMINIKNWNKKPFKLFFSLFFAIKKHNKIILMPATRGVKFVSNFTFLFKNKQIYHIVIGGSLATYLKKQKLLTIRMKKFKGIFVETEKLARDMEELGFKNVYELPNFKNIHFLKQSELVEWNGEEELIKVCTLSRVTKSKGINDAIEGVSLLNKELEFKKIELDVYGVIDSSYEEEFSKLLEQNEFVKYKGSVPHNETHIILKDYFVLLFPTFWDGEGFAGTLLDSLYAGIPVIASNWNLNAGIIKHMENGIIINVNSPKEIKESISFLLSHIVERNEMGYKNYIKSLNYKPDAAMKIFYDKLLE